MADITVMNDVTVTKDKKMGMLSRMTNILMGKSAKGIYKYVAMPLLVWMASRGFAQAEDLLSSGKADAQESFGENSTFMYFIMLAEVAGVLILFARQHNPALLLLIPVFIVATKIIFNIINGRFGATT